MKDVPADRLLIQPTVQYRWLKQHGTIEFNLYSELIDQFLVLWPLYNAMKRPNPRDFFSDQRLLDYDLVNRDDLFALLAGAIFAKHQCDSFRAWLQNGKLFWSITPTP